MAKKKIPSFNFNNTDPHTGLPRKKPVPKNPNVMTQAEKRARDKVIEQQSMQRDANKRKAEEAARNHVQHDTRGLIQKIKERELRIRNAGKN